MAIVAVLPYVAVWPREFTNWDDPLYVSGNGSIQYLTPATLGILLREPVAGNWIPVTMLSYAVDWQVWGGLAWGFAVTNAVLYGGACLLLPHVLIRLGSSPGTAWLAALLFAVHPLHVEPVAWISGRKDLLALLGLLMMLSAYVHGALSGRTSAWLGSLWLLLLAGLSKPIAMSAGPVLLLLERWVLRRPWSLAVRHTGGHLAICVGIAGVAVLAQQHDAAIRGADDVRWGNVGRAAAKLCLDLFRCFVPVLDSTYFPPELLDGVPVWACGVAVALLVVCTVGCAWTGGASRSAGRVAWCFSLMLLFLLPTSGVLPLGWTSVADRYLLIPSAVSCFAGAWGVRRLCRPDLQRVMIPLAAALSLSVYLRAGHWASSFDLWQHAIRQHPQAVLPWVNLTAAWYEQGMVTRAADVAEEALSRHPEEWRLVRNAVEIWLVQGNLSDASQQLEWAATRHVDDADLAVLSAKLDLRLEQPERARSRLTSVAASCSKCPEVWGTLSYACERLGEMSAARDAAEAALHEEPRQSERWRRVVELQLKTGDRTAALQTLARACQTLPFAREIWQFRVELLRQKGESAAAQEVARESARYLSPPLSTSGP